MLAACFAMLAALPAWGQPGATYSGLVEQYARGQRAEAVAGLDHFSQDKLIHEHGEMRAASLRAERLPCSGTPEQRDRCNTGLELRRRLLRAAVMLHWDRDEDERPEPSGNEQRRPCPGRHASFAGRYASLLARWPETKDFARRFFLAVALRCQWDACFDHGLRWARDGLKLFPLDGLLLLAAGSILEESATLASGKSTEGSAGLRQRQRDEIRAAVAARQQYFRDARRYFEEALAADADLSLARVRLGRVLWRLGQGDAARAPLEQATSSTADPKLLYLARLFLGRLHEDAGRLDHAALEYRLALALDPKAQAAAVALSHVLRLDGDAEGSRQTLSQALSHAGRRSVQDAHWNYLQSNALEVDELFDALRRETLQ